jgi:hypothetical protein
MISGSRKVFATKQALERFDFWRRGVYFGVDRLDKSVGQWRSWRRDLKIRLASVSGYDLMMYEHYDTNR